MRGLFIYIRYNEMTRLIIAIDLVKDYTFKGERNICHSIHCQEQSY